MPAEHLILAGVSGSPGSVHALRYTADLARHHDATLVPCPPRCRHAMTWTSASTRLCS